MSWRSREVSVLPPGDFYFTTRKEGLKIKMEGLMSKGLKKVVQLRKSYSREYRCELTRTNERVTDDHRRLRWLVTINLNDTNLNI